MRKYKKGQVFGKLTLLKELPRITKNKRTLRNFLFKCECGRVTEVDSANLRSMITVSCSMICGRFKNDTIIKHYYGKYKNGAKTRNLEFKLDLNDFIKITSNNCFYCGKEPIDIRYMYLKSIMTNRKSGESKTAYLPKLPKCFANGVDRKNSKKGYIKSNCIACCGYCNKAKLDKSVKEFINHANRIVKHQRKIKN